MSHRRLTEYNKYIGSKLSEGRSLSESIKLWHKYKKIKKGSRSFSRSKLRKSKKSRSKKSRIPKRSLKRVGSRSFRNTPKYRYK